MGTKNNWLPTFFKLSYFAFRRLWNDMKVQNGQAFLKIVTLRIREPDQSSL